MNPRFPADFWSHPRGRTEAFGASELFAGLRPLKKIARDTAHPRLSGPLFSMPEPEEPSLPEFDAAGKPVELYVPEHYEAKYAYPLIIWFHGRGGSERELHDLMPVISNRNYLGLSFRGPLASATRRPGYRWSLTDRDLLQLQDEVAETVRRLRGVYHVHSERIYLAGFDEGGTVALRLLLNRPEWFGGAASLAGQLPSTPNLLSRYTELQGKRVLLTAGTRDKSVPTETALQTSRLLHLAGMSVQTKICDAGHTLTPKMLNHVNHWVMHGICEAV